MPCWPPMAGLSLELCAVLYHISPMALYRLVCALGHQSLVTVLTRCGLPLPVYFLADEKHSRCLTDEGLSAHDRQWPVHLASGLHGGGQCGGLYPVLRRVSTRGALSRSPRIGSEGVLTDGFDSTDQEYADALSRGAPRLLPPPCAQQAPGETARRSRLRSVRHCARSSTPCSTERASARACGCLRWASGYATLLTTSPPRLGRPMASACGAGSRTRKPAGMRCSPIPQMPVTSTLLDQAHNAIERKLFAMKGFHHPRGSQQAFLTGLAHLYNLVPYQRRAQHAGQCGVEVEGGRSPHTRLVPQPANPHLRRLSLSADTLYHVIRWNVVFHNATTLDTAVDMLDPQSTLVQRLVRQCCSRGHSSPRGFFVGMRISTSGSVNDRKPRSCNNPLPAGQGIGGGLRHALIMHTAAIGVTEEEDDKQGIH